ncbi:hypothetical protein ACFVH0_08980 [Streptomyces sp. NPDC127117]|uniref:hypothetical protein n=1 Tax=Streptomyces sp. NPDC127117 TaxID=3345368 RepID=UPI00362BCF09
MTVMKETADAGKGFSLKDATSLGRYIYEGRVQHYSACFEKEVPEFRAVDIYVVPVTERCPARPGVSVSVPKAPDLTGGRVEESLLEALLSGYYPKRLQVFKIGDSSKSVPPRPLANWRVCAQNPEGGTKLDVAGSMKFYVAKKCP